MATVKFPPLPPQLKAVQHYLKLASDYEQRQPVVAYWARLYALQTALKIDKKSPEAKKLLTALMEWLEIFKKSHSDNEAVTNDVAGQAFLENEAHRLFMYADGEDRAARFNKNVVKSFYTAGIMLDVCEVFGELNEDVLSQRKYAKWKATYIHNCLKTGETPIPGPLHDEEGTLLEVPAPGGFPSASQETGMPPIPQQSPGNYGLPEVGSSSPNNPPVGFSASPSNQVPDYQLPSVPSPQPAPRKVAPQPSPVTGNAQLTPEEISKAQKFCKWAINALDYEDTKTAMENLQKAMDLLRGGGCS